MFAVQLNRNEEDDLQIPSKRRTLTQRNSQTQFTFLQIVWQLLEKYRITYRINIKRLFLINLTFIERQQNSRGYFHGMNS